MKWIPRILSSSPFPKSILQGFGGELFETLRTGVNKSQVATIKYFAPPKDFGEIEWPDPANRRPKFVPKMPVFQGKNQPRKMRKMIGLMRGPEHVHNFLIHKQYGIQALTGGRMKAQNFDFLRHALVKKFDYDKSFFLWRIDPPWQAVSKKGSGKRMGGGKASIHHYVTPVRAGRIILEFGGTLPPEEVEFKLAPLAENLPFPARFVTQEMLEEEKKREEWKEKNNRNPYTFKYVILNNMGGCNNWLSRYDYLWFGKYK